MTNESRGLPSPKTAITAPSEQKGAMLINPGTPTPPAPPAAGTPPFNHGPLLVNPGTPSAPTPPTKKG